MNYLVRWKNLMYEWVGWNKIMRIYIKLIEIFFRYKFRIFLVEIGVIFMVIGKVISVFEEEEVFDNSLVIIEVMVIIKEVNF